MKNKLHYSPESLRDLDEIWDAIAGERQNPSAAERVIRRLLDTAERLESFSGMGAPLSSITGMESDVRFLVSGSYLLFYRAVENDVYIDRILYGHRDYLRLLFKDQLHEKTSE